MSAVERQFKIVIDQDGCHRGTLRVTPALLSYDEAVGIVSRHIPPAGTEFGIIDNRTGRQVSYMLPYAGRRVRLKWGHFVQA